MIQETPFARLVTTPEGDQAVIQFVVIGAGIAFVVGTQYRSTPFDHEFEEIGKREAVEPDLLRAIARHESGFNPSAISPKNSNGTRDYGLMQINEATAKTFGYAATALVGTTGVRSSITIAAKLLKAVKSELGSKANIFTIIAAYNAGSGNIKQRGIFNQAYVGSVALHLQLYAMGSLTKGATA